MNEEDRKILDFVAEEKKINKTKEKAEKELKEVEKQIKNVPDEEKELLIDAVRYQLSVSPGQAER